MPNPYITDDRLETDPPEAASFPYEQVVNNRLFEERTVAANMKVQGVKLSAWADRIIDLEGGGGGGVEGAVDTFDTRADVLAATISAAVDLIDTRGYAAIGDGGHGRYKRLAAMPSSGSTNRGYIQSADGTWWALAPQGGIVYIEQFGGVADYVTSTGIGTDNFTPLTHALAYYAKEHPTNPAVKWTYIIQFGVGNYYFSAGFDLHVQNHIRGCSRYTGETLWFTNLYFPATVDNPFIFGANNTLGASTGSTTGQGAGTIEGLAIHFTTYAPVTKSDAESTTAAIWMRTTSNIIDVGVFSAPGHAFLIRGTAGGGTSLEGNVNQWNVRDCLVHTTGWHALCIQGQDANGGRCHGFVTHSGVNGCAIYNDSAFTSSFTGLQITGYRNTGIHYAGNRYQLISSSPTTASSTTPGTNDLVWYFFSTGGATANWIEWSAGDYHVPGLPIWDNGNGSIYLHPYTEVGGAAVIHTGNSRLVGGTCGATIYSNHDFGNLAYNKQGTGFQIEFAPGDPQGTYTKMGSLAQVVVGGKATGLEWYDATGGLNIFSHRLEKENVTYRYAYRGNDIWYWKGSGNPWWRLLTGSTTEAMGGPVPTPHRFVLGEFGINSGDGNDTVRLFGSHGAIPAGPTNNYPGYYARGARFFSTVPTVGGTGWWVCTTSGVIHQYTWITGTEYVDNSSVIKTAAGRYYIARSDGVSTVEPTHTSAGETTLADGRIWEYLGSTAAVFTPVADIANDFTTTTSQPLLNLTQTWNDGAVTFTGLKANFTSTASAANSIMLDLQMGGSSKWKADKDGDTTQTGTATIVSGTAATAGGAAMVSMTSGAVGILVGSGVPTASASQGSLYLRTDGSSTSTRAYINTDGGTTWTAVTTAA
jgi:hypothetical protein